MNSYDLCDSTQTVSNANTQLHDMYMKIMFNLVLRDVYRYMKTDYTLQKLGFNFNRYITCKHFLNTVKIVIN